MTYVLWIMLLFMALFLVRVVMGPSIWDRLLGLNLVATKTIIIIIVFASISDVAFLMDFAIVYALFGFIGTIFIAMFLSARQKKMRAREVQAQKDEYLEGEQ